MRLPQATLLKIVLQLALLLSAAYALTNPLNISPTTKYSFTGTQIFNTAPYFGTTNNNANPLVYSLTFPKAQMDALYKSNICIQQIHCQLSGGRFNLTFMLNAKTVPSLDIEFYSNLMNQIQSLTIRYITVASAWATFSFYYFMEPVMSSVSSTSPYSFTSSGTLNAVSMTGTVKSFFILTGFDITAADGTNELGLKISMVRSTSTTVSGTLTSGSSKLIRVEYISYSCLSYNEAVDITNNAIPGKFTLGSFSATNGGVLAYNDATNIVRAYNTMIGLYEFHIVNQGFLSWNASITPSVSISATSSNSFKAFGFNYLIMEEQYCGDLTPYLMVATNICYDICPERYYDNDVSMECSTCRYDCYYCTPNGNGSCTICNATFDFRVFNNVTLRCDPLPGYYDGGTNSSVALLCNNATCLTCTTLTKCSSCHPAFYLSGTSCLACMANCLNCTSATTCLQCLAPYVFNTTCVPNCSLIANCAVCAVSGNDTLCSNCSLGFSLAANNTCNQVCGDGIRSGAEGCDDHNLVNSDGCNSVCVIETAYFCTGAVGSLSTCLQCLVNCLNCTSATTCTLCASLYVFAPAVPACQADCSLITNCSTCSVNSSVLVCLSCIMGYFVDATGNCSAICGDGLILGTEGCDDGNTNSSDGCSSVCQIEAVHYCVGQPSTCGFCLTYCLACTVASDCQSCRTNTTWVAANTTCSPTCSAVTYCTACAINNATAEILCSACSNGYSVDPANGMCAPICGDGIVAPQEVCDDANKAGGDGCSSVCQVETYYTCNGTSGTGSSLCYLTSMKIDFISILKQPDQNSAILTFQPTPPGLPVYNTIDWAALITIQPSSATVKSATYDPATGLITVDVDYSSTIDNTDLNVKFDPAPQNSIFTYLPPVTSPVKASSENNQALYYYSSDDYQMAALLKYAALGVGVLALLFIIAGLLGGRLVGLETSGVIQLTFLSLVTLNNMSPTFTSLQFLSLSCGYNHLHSYNSKQSISKPFKASELSLQYIDNYNFMAAFILLPFLISLFFRLYARITKKERTERWIKLCKYSMGEFTLYGLLAFSYLSYLSFFITLAWGGEMMGLAAGGVVFLLGVVFLVVYAKADTYFEQFKSKFELDRFGQLFYLIPMIERILVPALLVFMAGFPYTNGVIVAIYLALLVIVAAKKPYAGERKCWRPVANYTIVIAIQAIFQLVNFTADPSSMFAIYGPLAIVGLLLVCLVYSIYALVVDIKISLQNLKAFFSEQSQQQQEMSLDAIDMKQFTQKFLQQDSISIFRQKGQDVPLPTAAVKDKLSQIKQDLGQQRLARQTEVLDRKMSEEVMNMDDVQEEAFAL